MIESATTTLEYSGDFRALAVVASAAGCAASRSDLFDQRDSLCLITEQDPWAISTIRTETVWLGVGGTILLGAGFLVLPAAYLMDSGTVAVVGIVLILVATGMAVVETIFRRRVMRGVVRRRIGCVPAGAACVNVEDGLTYSQYKVMSDDIGLLWTDRERRCAVIEGLRYRYVISAKDVFEIRRRGIPGFWSTQITYRVGSSHLVLVFVENHNNPWEQYCQLLLIRPRLFRKLKRVLDPIKPS
jgi:hypothetical protein